MLLFQTFFSSSKDFRSIFDNYSGLKRNQLFVLRTNMSILFYPPFSLLWSKSLHLYENKSLHCFFFSFKLQKRPLPFTGEAKRMKVWTLVTSTLIFEKSINIDHDLTTYFKKQYQLDKLIKYLKYRFWTS